jgi:hypothetical protein
VLIRRWFYTESRYQKPIERLGALLAFDPLKVKFKVTRTLSLMQKA